MSEKKKKMLQVDENIHTMIKIQAAKKGMTINNYLKYIALTVEKQIANKD